MCQEILVDGNEIHRQDGTCWCPLNWGSAELKHDGAPQTQEEAFADLGRQVYRLLSEEKPVDAAEWAAQLVVRRW